MHLSHKCIYPTNTFNPQMHLTHKCIYPINAFIPQMHLSYKCIYINAFAINAFLSLLIYLPRHQTLAIILMSFLLSIIY